MTSLNLNKTKDLLNDERDIGFGYKVNDLYNMEYPDVVKFFRDRINSFYIKPGNFIIKKIKRKKTYASNFGFVIITLSSILIDTLSQYRYGNIQSTTNFKLFLKEYVSEFDNTYSSPGKVYLKDNMSIPPKNSSDVDFADIFYSGFRCGIMHNGKILSYGGYVYKQKALLAEHSWNDSNSDTRLELSIDPVILFKKMKLAFKKYIKELLNNLHRTEFLKKFEFEFGFNF